MDERKSVIARLRELDENVTRLGHITALLEWDQETYMPEGGAEERASQIALMSGLHHEKTVDGEWSRLFASLEGHTDTSAPSDVVEQAFLRESHKRLERKSRVSRTLVEKLARATSLAQTAWIQARKNDDFASFAPHLQGVIDLERQYAEAVAPGADIYDTLLDDYEPDARGDEIALVFDGLAEGLGRLKAKIDAGRRPDDSFLKRSYPIAGQDEFGRRVQEWMGYDTRRGRLDLSAHPFTTTLGPDDVRVTTRYDEGNVLSGLFSNIHEAGHGLYEQGFGSAIRGSILADGTSLGIHESQSRFWENVLGRSRAFWEHRFPEFQALFPQNLEDVDAEGFYRAANIAESSLIRVDADEVTYSFHIIIRFRLERALIDGSLAVADLPAAWNDAYEEYLGIRPPSDADGCLQDVHWSAGLFGYFPTYALGNLYAAQFTRTMEGDIGPLSSHVGNDDAAPVLDWLRSRIHVHGRVYPPGELCRNITGQALDPQYFLSYLEDKYADIYSF